MTFKMCVRISAFALTFILANSTVRADVVVVVSAKNPIATLSKSQVADIFLGKTIRFPNGAPSVPIDLNEGSSVRDEFYATFASKSAAQLKAHWAKIIFTGRGQPPRTVSDFLEVRKVLAANPQAIAYIDRSAVDQSMRVLAQP